MNLRIEIRKILLEYFSTINNCDYLEFMDSQYNRSPIEEILKKNSTKNVNEGLINSVPPEKTLQILNKIVGEANIVLFRNRGVLFINLLNIKNIERLLFSIKNIGYFISEIILLKKDSEDLPKNYLSIKYSEQLLYDYFKEKENYKILSIQVNGKRINEVEWDGFLYHISSEANLPKILKNGLVPKSKSKKVYHPERIYFTKDINDSLLLKSQFEEHFNNKMVILKISTKGLKDFKLYNDPDYSNYGVFTLDNIPPQNINQLDIIKP